MYNKYNFIPLRFIFLRSQMFVKCRLQMFIWIINRKQKDSRLSKKGIIKQTNRII